MLYTQLILVKYFTVSTGHRISIYFPTISKFQIYSALLWKRENELKFTMHNLFWGDQQSCSFYNYHNKSFLEEPKPKELAFRLQFIDILCINASYARMAVI